MKAFLSILGGFLITLSAFAGGAVYAVSLLAVETAPAPNLDISASTAWSSEAIKVAAVPREDAGIDGGKETGANERITAVIDFAHAPIVTVDPTLTAVVPEEEAAIIDVSLRSEGHQAWCARRYRSYDADTDTYRPYRGGARPCVSPFSSGEQDIAAQAGNLSGDAYMEDAAYVEVSAAEDYGQSCAARYRSYRASDNTYQPLSGGPRRQCR
jgi:hypothetical protein